MGQIILASSSNTVLEGDLFDLPKPLSEMSIAHIFTAAKGSSSLESTYRRQNLMREKGYNFEPLDIEGKNEEELASLLANKELIFVDMGNTFYLMNAINESGFDNVVRQRISEGAIYLGASAGSYVACPTIEMATWKHPDVNRYDLADLKAMNLVDFLVTVHYDPKNEVLLRQKISESQYPVKILTDQQAILVDGNETKLVGEGEEIKLIDPEVKEPEELPDYGHEGKTS